MPNTPHGEKLVNRIASGEEADEISGYSIKKILVSREVFQTAENIATGLYSPLTGFMGKKDFEACLEKGRLADETPWTLPVVFDVDEGDIEEGEQVSLENEGGSVLFEVKEIYPYSKEKYAKAVFGTTDKNHPGVEKVYAKKNYFAGGGITLLRRQKKQNREYILEPEEARKLIKEKGWRTVAAFQTRNVPHVGHEYVQKTALNIAEGLLVNPVLGKKKEGDYKDELIFTTYNKLINEYFPPEHVALGFIDYEMHYAGPREAVHHAIMRKNLGCTHFIVGRDHAGVDDYYGPYDAQEIFKHYPDLGMEPIFFSSFFHCKKCAGPASEKTCPHEEHREKFKGTYLREKLSAGENPPAHLMRPEVAELIRKHSSPFI